MTKCKGCACHNCFERNCTNCRECIRGEKNTKDCLFRGDDGEPLTPDENS
jgi:hypothetical protein